MAEAQDRTAEHPVLSICVPTYNRSQLLGRLLDWLDQPGFLPFAFEVVVADNASTDPGYDAISRFEPKNFLFRYYRRPVNLGLERNLTGGFRLARGEFCLSLSDDDRLIPAELAAIIKAMQADPSIGATYAAWQAVNIDTGEVKQNFQFEDLTVYPDHAAMLAKRIAGWSLSIPETAVIRTDIAARAVFASPVLHFAFSMLRRVLAFTPVRFSSRAFYQLGHDDARDQTNSGRQSSSYRFEGWSALARSYRVFHFRVTGERFSDVGEGREQMLYLQLIRNTVYEAQNQHRLAEALEALDHLQSLTSLEMVTAEYDRTLRFLASIDQMRLAIETLPDVTILAAVDMDPGIDALVRDTFGNAGSTLAHEKIAYAPDLPVEGRAFLTLTDQARAQIIQNDGVRPGYVFSIQSLKAAFGF